MSGYPHDRKDHPRRLFPWRRRLCDSASSGKRGSRKNRLDKTQLSSCIHILLFRNKNIPDIQLWTRRHRPNPPHSWWAKDRGTSLDCHPLCPLLRFSLLRFSSNRSSRWYLLVSGRGSRRDYSFSLQGLLVGMGEVQTFSWSEREPFESARQLCQNRS